MIGKSILHFFFVFFCLFLTSAKNSKAEEAELPKELAEELKRAEEEGGDSRFLQEFMNMLFSLGILIACALVIMWLLKRFLTSKIEKTNITSDVKILERRTLSPKTTLYILKFGDKTVAIAESLNGVTLLFRFPPKRQELEK